MKFIAVSDEQYAALEAAAAERGTYAGDVLNALIASLTAAPAEQAEQAETQPEQPDTSGQKAKRPAK